VAAGLLARNGLALGVGNVALALLLTRESPAGEATALCVAAAALAWWSRPTQGHVPAPAGPAPRPPGPLDRRGALQEH
jgi:hypothetical protein